MTIKLGGIEFTGPHYLDHCNVPESSGIYAIMIHTDANNYEIIYVGESSNLSERLTTSHHKYDCWKKYGETIHYGLYVMSNSTQERRMEFEGQLINLLKPKCND